MPARVKMTLVSVMVAFLALIGAGIGTGCAGLTTPRTGASATQPSKADMVRVATQTEITLKTVEGNLNDAFNLGKLPSSLHATLDPYVKAARKYADAVSTAATNGDATEFQFSYQSFTSFLSPLLTAVAQSQAVTPPTH